MTSMYPNVARKTSLLAVIWGLLLLFPSFAVAQATTPVLLWNPPVGITFPTPLSNDQYRVRVLAGPPVAVPLTSSYNITGITTNGTPFNTGGFDNSGWAFSAELLGRSVTWQGLSFPIGPPNVNDVVTSTTIALPPGRFANLSFLADLVNGQMPPTAHFIVHYTDGTTADFDQSLSDWVIPLNYPGESLAACMPSRHLLDGSTDLNSVCVYGYQFPLDPTRTVASITLPQDRDVLVLSLVLLPPEVPGTLTFFPAKGTVLPSGAYVLSASFIPASPSSFLSAGATQPLTVGAPVPLITPTISWTDPKPIPPGTPLGPVQLDATASALQGNVAIPLAPYYRINAMYADGTQYLEKGLDGTSTALSSTQLGTSLDYAGATFALGPPAVPDAASNSTISLPAGQYKSLSLLGSAGFQAEVDQPFVITYTDGTSTHASLNLSSWKSAQHFAGETTVAQTTEADLANGSQLAGTFTVYGYQIALDSTRTVQTLTLPPNSDVVVLAAGLDPGVSFPVAGAYVYTPSAGFIPTGPTLLSTHFVPSDANDLTSANGSARVLVGIMDFSLTAQDGTSLTGHMGDSLGLLFQVAPTDGLYASNLSFSLTGALPPLSTVSFSPSTLAPSAGPRTVRMTIATRLLSGRASSLSVGRTAVLSLAACAFLFLPWRRLRLPARLLALCLLFTLLPAGCGSGYRDVIYPLTLTASDGTTQHSFQVTLHILASAQ